ncbi:MAG: hypothetical protein HY277_05310, partial [Ignavibacteriales bacterium]|nr:hypothetical protein [Ignavibacteriales bacterium]
MKTLTIYCALTLLVLLVALLCGCQNQGPFDPSIRGGVNEVGQPRSAAIRAPIVTIPFVPVVPEVDLGVYQMPPPKDGVVAVAADSQYIIAAIGGTLSCVDSYVDYNGQLVTRAATLTIPPLALRNDGMISMSLNPTELAVDFAPEGLVFRHQIGLDFSVTGISELKSGAP